MNLLLGGGLGGGHGAGHGLPSAGQPRQGGGNPPGSVRVTPEEMEAI